jgi:hypothetical protein
VTCARVNPSAEVFVFGDPGSANGEEATHRAARELHRPDVRLAERGVRILGIQADHHVLAERADGPVPVDHPRDAPEHLALGHAIARTDDPPDPLCKFRRVRHRENVTRPAYRALCGTGTDR